MVVTEFIPEIVAWAKIKVIWVWWAGTKAINRMVSEWLEWVEFVAVNTDAQDLATSLANKKVNIGLNLTKGLWAGANPEIGRKSAEESEAEIKEMLKETDMVFITWWMWGWTFTWAGPVVANIAKEMGILTVWIVTKPFNFEWKKRTSNAEVWLEKMKPSVDTLIVIPNDKIFNIIDKKTTFKQAFMMIDRILFLWVQGISDLIVKPGDINIDFADIKAVMQNSGNAVLWIWYGAGEKRAVDAARKAIENPLLETNVDRAKSVIFAVSWWIDLTPTEVQEAAAVVEDILDEDVNMIWGMTFDETMEDEVKVTIIATGFEEQSDEEIIKRPNRDILGRPTQTTKSENFVSRAIDSTAQESHQQSNTHEVISQPEQNPEEDLETPAFIRKRLNS